MTFIVVFIALVIERFFDWSHLRRWYWFYAWERTITQKFSQYNAPIVLALIVVPLILLVTVLHLLFHDVLYGLATLMFDLLVILYCLGPQNLWVDGFACANTANEYSEKAFGINQAGDTQILHKSLLDSIFVEANRRIFAVIFWFVLLNAIIGPVAAFLYRLLNLIILDKPGQDALRLEVAKNARLLIALLDWLPVRLFTFIFALAGHFSQVLMYWKKNLKLSLAENDILLMQCGAAALGGEGRIAEDGSAEKNAISLLDRVFVIVVLIVAVGALIL